MMNNKLRRRSSILFLVFIIISLIVAIALFKLQIISYDLYQEEVLNQLTVETRVNPERGTIYDRNWKILATNETVWVLYAMPKNIKNPDEIASEIAKILSTDYEKVYKKIVNKSYKYQIINNKISESDAQKIRIYIDENGLEDELQLSASTKRYYPYSTLASHTLGFVNSDGIGIYGLEKTYNNVLEGTSGKYITAQNAQSGDMPFQFEEYLESENSYSIVSTIDLYMQYQLEAQLKKASIEAGAQNRATGIIMNPKTGEIYAMATYPSFDLNDPYQLDESSQNKLDEYEKGTKEYKNQYLELLYSMWKNKAITELYEPGSTFKLFTTSVALQENAATLKNSYSCSGSLKIDGFYRAISCHKRTGHGTLSFAEALQQSCNPSMMKIAFSIGKNKFYTYFQRFGYTGKTGIDLPSEAKGYYHEYDEFSNVSLAVYSFGQTFKTTPIQQLRAISVVANGGELITPHLLKEIVDKNGEVVYEYEDGNKEKILDTSVCKDISLILKEGVDGLGGAQNAYVAGYSIAAKTGTSEKKDKYDENGNTPYRVSSCIAYAPSEDAEISMIFIVDEPTVGSAYGSVVAAPYVSRLMELILPYLGVEPSYDTSNEEYAKISVPNLENLEINYAKENLEKLGISYEIIGNGSYVKGQFPKNGNEIFIKSGKVYLYTEKEANQYTVPNVVGKTPEEANKILVNAGFNVKIVGNYNNSNTTKVVAQFPYGGTIAQKGEIITIEVLCFDENE